MGLFSIGREDPERAIWAAGEDGSSDGDDAVGQEGQEEGGARKTPRQRFLELAPKRTQAVLEKLRLLSNCGNRAAYEYHESEVRQIFEAIEEELRRTRASFEKRKRREFRFREEMEP